MSKVFLDTNILLYSVDKKEPTKRENARQCLASLKGEIAGVISTQVLQEFYVIATKKLGGDPVTTKELLQYFQKFEVVTVTPPMIEQAVDCSVLSQLSFWDALIVTAAEQAKCEMIWTEDLNAGQVIRGVRVENPLSNS